MKQLLVLVVLLWSGVLGAFGLLALILPPERHSQGYQGIGFLMILAAAAPIVLLLIYRRSMDGARMIKLRAAADLNADCPAHYVHVEGSSGIALNPASKVVAVMEKGVSKRYHYIDVREWATSEQQAAVVIGTGLAAAGAMMQSGAQAARNTGLFLKVKDVGFPEWHVGMSDRKVRARWFEMLTQELNEGGMSRAI